MVLQTSSHNRVNSFQINHTQSSSCPNLNGNRPISICPSYFGRIFHSKRSLSRYKCIRIQKRSRKLQIEDMVDIEDKLDDMANCYNNKLFICANTLSSVICKLRRIVLEYYIVIHCIWWEDTSWQTCVSLLALKQKLNKINIKKKRKCWVKLNSLIVDF